MAGAGRFEVAPLTMIHGSAQNLHLQQLQNCRVVAGSQMTRVRPGGTVRQLAMLLARANPVVNFATRDLTTFFGAVSPTVGLAATGNTTIRLMEREEGGAFVTSADNVTLTATGGLMIPVSISAERDSTDGAVLQAQFIPKYDGTNLPLVIADSVDFSAAPAAAFTSQFYLGPVYHNAAEIVGVVSSSVEFGITVSAVPHNPGPYNKSLCVVDIAPRLVFAVTKCDAVAAVNMFSRALTSSVALYYQKGTASTDRVAVGTSAHCKVSCTAGAIETQEIGGEAGQDALLQVTVHPTSDLSISVASTIP